MKLSASAKDKPDLVIAMYAHIEGYPPSLNALYHLAPHYNKVFVLVRNIMVSNWHYPENVVLVASGKFVPAEKVGNVSLIEKLKGYVSFGFSLKQLVKEKKPAMVVLYDMIAFSLFNIFSGISGSDRKPQVWYHNHDVAMENEVGRYSVMRLLKRMEIRYFKRTDWFTLPNAVRLRYFPVADLQRAPVILPNYPSRFFFGKWRAEEPGQGVLKLIFQGHISEAAALEKVIEILKYPVQGRKLELHLAGPINSDYQSRLLRLAQKDNVERQLFFYGRIPYAELPKLTASCHIGLALYGSHNTMVRTMSTASNKIFEYGCVGLPVIVNRRSDMQDEFSAHSWIRFSDLDPDALFGVVGEIASKYTTYSEKARTDFEEKLNFETTFCPFLKCVQNTGIDRDILITR